MFCVEVTGTFTVYGLSNELYRTVDRVNTVAVGCLSSDIRDPKGIGLLFLPVRFIFEFFLGLLNKCAV